MLAAIFAYTSLARFCERTEAENAKKNIYTHLLIWNVSTFKTINDNEICTYWHVMDGIFFLFFHIADWVERTLFFFFLLLRNIIGEKKTLSTNNEGTFGYGWKINLWLLVFQKIASRGLIFRNPVYAKKEYNIDPHVTRPLFACISLGDIITEA